MGIRWAVTVLRPSSRGAMINQKVTQSFSAEVADAGTL